MAIIGYARTSTTEQQAGLEDQIRVLTEFGCERIFSEHASGANSDRVEFMRCMDFLRDGDTLVITKLDRLARTVFIACKTVNDLSSKGVGFKVLDFPLIDTTTPTGTLVLQMFAAIAEFERTNMLVRQRIGIDKAKAEGRYTGGQFKLTDEQAQALQLKVAQGTPVSDAAKQFGISRATAYNYLDRVPGKNPKRIHKKRVVKRAPS